MAGIMGTSTQHLTNLLAEPAPFPLRPLNWCAVDTPGMILNGHYMQANYFGAAMPPGATGPLAAAAYAGPYTPGFTWGAPVGAREDFS